MKVLFLDTTQAFLTPGGKTVHAHKLHRELRNLGVDVEFSRWWDESQSNFDVLHMFSASSKSIVQNAKRKGKKVLLTHILDYETNKSNLEKIKAILQIRVIEKLPSAIQSKFDWSSLPLFDHIVYMHKYDRQTALDYYSNLDESKTSIIPHAFDPQDMGISSNVDLHTKLPEKFLISCGTICERKQSVLLAKLAKAAKTPVIFIGSNIESDSYFQQFLLEIDNKNTFYLGYVDKEVKDFVESRASGFVLLSKGESGCIAVFEAAAYKLPLLLSNLPWAWGYENPSDISFCDFKNWNVALRQLKTFYADCSKLAHTPFIVNSWKEIALRYKKCYEQMLVP